MDVINKLYSSVSSTVSSTVSQLSGVLPGNPVTREYEVTEHIASAGLGLLWKVYKGFKKSTRQEVAVFVFEKKQLERWPKEDRENMFEILKRGVTQLTKIRHPNVLTVQHPLEESRESLAFATEPIFACLANVLNCNQNSNYNLPSGNNFGDFKLYEVEIKHGILQLSEAFSFIHTDMKMIHRNLCPESIIINKNGSWKLFGFDFCLTHQIASDGKMFWPHQEYNSTWHALTQPSLEYTAPEVALKSIISPESDLFALGMLIYTIYSGGKAVKLFGKDYSSFRRFANEINQGKYPNLSCIPTNLSDFVRLLIHASPSQRPKLHELSKIQFFDDVAVKTLNYLDSLYQWDNLQKSKFYKGLTQIIPTLPHRINVQHILPCLAKEFINATMIPFVLPNVLLIADKSSKTEYIEQILPYLKPVMKIQDPIQILLIFMQNMNILLKLTPPDEIKENVLPMLYRALECDMPQMQELCLATLPTFSSLIDYHATKNALIPRIKKLCLNTQTVSVKVNCLICIGKLLENLDKWLVLDEILPFLIQIQCREPAVLMGIIGIIRIAMSNSKLGITKEVMATKIIPFLMPLCIENGLTVNQFNSIITLVKDMVNNVEKEHRIKIEQLNNIQKETGTLDPKTMTMINSSENSETFESIFSSMQLDDDSKIAKIKSTTENAISNLQGNSNLKAQTIRAPLPAPPSHSDINSLPKSLNYPTFISSPPAPATSNFKGTVNVPVSNLTSPTQTHNANSTFLDNSFNLNPWPNMSSSSMTLTNNKISPPVNNNLSSLRSLDPLLGMRNTGGSKVSMNQLKTDGGLGAVRTPLLTPQNQSEYSNSKTSSGLSQQDILDFLN